MLQISPDGFWRPLKHVFRKWTYKNGASEKAEPRRPEERYEHDRSWLLSDYLGDVVGCGNDIGGNLRHWGIYRALLVAHSTDGTTSRNDQCSFTLQVIGLDLGPEAGRRPPEIGISRLTPSRGSCPGKEL